jgi:hypothetical protein
VTALNVLVSLLPAVLLPTVMSSATPGGDRGGCSVIGDADAQQVALALAACATSRQRLQELFGEPAATVHLRFVPELPLTSFLVARGTVTAFVPALPGDADSLGSFQHWERSAPHELAHALYNARTGVRHVYGPGDGDWFVEAVAIWAEDDARRQQRIVQAASTHGRVLELPSVLRMHHPMQDSRGVSLERITTRTCRGECPGITDTLSIREFTRADGTRSVDTLAAGSPVLAQGEVATAFYAVAIAVLQFVHEHGGPAAVRLVEERLRAGAGNDALVNVPGLPPAFEDFVREWEAWLERAALREAPALVGADGRELPAAQQ